MGDFWTGAGIALILLAVCGPVAYCTAHINALELECIKAKGEWKEEGWSIPRCVFPKSASTVSGEK